MSLVVTDEDRLKQRIASGIVVLGVRRGLMQVIFTISNIVLARMLLPQIFGMFAIIAFLILNLGELTNFGLIPALIQKKVEIEKRDLRVIFTTVVLASLIFSVVISILAPFIVGLYGSAFGKSGIFWLRLFSLNLVFVNLSSISTALLERGLRYKRLVLGQVSVLFLTKFLIIVFALKGLGVGSFVLGTIIGSLFGFVFLFYLSPWSIGLNFSYNRLRRFLSFGLNMQANKLIGVVNGAVVPGFVGAVSGSEAVGLVNWAAGLRQAGLAPYEVLEQLTFAAGSRMQENKKLLKTLVERMIELSSILSFPLLATLFALAPTVTVLVYTEKWLPGLTALYLSIIQAVFILLGGIFIQVLLALGKARTVRNISLFWAILTWAFTIPFVILWGFEGVIVAGILVSSTFFIPLREVRKQIDIKVVPNVLPYLIYAILTGVFLMWIQSFYSVGSFFGLVLVASLGLVFYLSMLALFKREKIISDALRLWELINY